MWLILEVWVYLFVLILQWQSCPHHSDSAYSAFHLTTSQHWFRWWFGIEQAIVLSNDYWGPNNSFVILHLWPVVMQHYGPWYILHQSISPSLPLTKRPNSYPLNNIYSIQSFQHGTDTGLVLAHYISCLQALLVLSPGLWFDSLLCQMWAKLYRPTDLLSKVEIPNISLIAYCFMNSSYMFVTF